MSVTVDADDYGRCNDCATCALVKMASALITGPGKFIKVPDSRISQGLGELFEAYTDPETLRFTRTRSTIKLATLGRVLVSRSEEMRFPAG